MTCPSSQMDIRNKGTGGGTFTKLKNHSGKKLAAEQLPPNTRV